MRMFMPIAALLLILQGCEEDPYAHWPDPTKKFPYISTAQADLDPYERIRWETETWSQDDLQKAGLYMKKLLLHRRDGSVETVQHFKQQGAAMPPLTGGAARLSLVGDVMWVKGNWKSFAMPPGKLLDGDLRVGNLETPTSPDHSTAERALGTYSFNAPTEMLDGLPLDLLQLNNNHSLDAADLGLENTIKQVEQRGLKHTGVDRQLRLTVDGVSMAFLAYTWGLNDKKRSQKGHELHIIPFGHQDKTVDLSLLERQVAAARADGVEAVVLLLHWGYEFEFYPDTHFMVLARRMIKAGADLVVGHGPHVAQPAELCHVNRPEVVPGIGTCSVRTDDGRQRTAAVLYSLGDFGTTLPTIPTKSGLVATVDLDRDGVRGLGWAGVYSEDIKATDGKVTGQVVKPLADLAKSEVVMADELKRLETHLGKGWRR